jgi:membrane protease YdiL (CAAX protease family)
MSSVSTKKTGLPKKPTTKAIPQSPDLSNISDGEVSVRKEKWNPYLGILYAVLVFIGAQIISELLLSTYRFPKHWTNPQVINWLTNSISAQFFYVLLAEAITVIAIVYFVRQFPEGLKKIGVRKPRWSDIVYALAGLPIYLILFLVGVSVLTHIFPGLNVSEKQQLGFNNVSGTLEIVLTFISLVILPPIAEEILFRGFLYSTFKSFLPKAFAVLATCTLFAVGHLPEGGSAGPLYIAAIDTFILSLVLIALREQTGGIWSSMLLHGMKNAIAFMALYGVLIH